MTFRITWPEVAGAKLYRICERRPDGSIPVWSGAATSAELPAGEYRVQALVEGAYQLVRPYQRVDADMDLQGDSARLVKSLLKGLLTGELPEPVDELPAISGPLALQHADWLVTKTLGAHAQRSRIHWYVLRRLEAGDGVFADVKAMLSFFSEADPILSELSRSPRAAYEARAGELMAILDRLEAEQPSAVHQMNRGRLVSLFSRQEAVPLITASPFKTYFDNGAHTYFESAEPWRPEPLPMELPTDPDIEATLVMSADPRFLRFYAPYWLNLAPFLRREGLRFVIFVPGEGAVEAIEEARDLLDHMVRYRRLSDNNPITFVPVQVPSTVGEALAFYACARFLHAADVLDATRKPVLIIDADLTVREPIGPMLKTLSAYDFGRPCATGSSVLTPWRRELAGSVFVNSTDAGRRLLSTIAAYINAGLSAEKGWMLDQNAIAYATEVVDARKFDIATTARPFAQELQRVMFERTF